MFGSAESSSTNDESGRTSGVADGREIQRQTGRTFHLATRVLPERVRHPTYVLYAFFRIADDVVDDPDPRPPSEQHAELDRIEAAALGETDTAEPVLDAFRELATEHGIPDREIEVFMDAMRTDVDASPFPTAAALDEYLRGSAVAVAYMMLSVLDPPDADAARPHAKALGEAFQLTNFLRDVREDVREYDRVYLPEKTLETNGVTREQIERLEFDHGFAAAMRAELARTEARYRTGVAGIELLPADCRLAVLAAATLYAEHHRLIRRQGMDVLSRRPTLSTPRRLWVLARTWVYYTLTGDPERTFYRVAPIDPNPPPAGEPGATADPDPAQAGDTTPTAPGTPRGGRELPCRWLHGLCRAVRGTVARLRRGPW